VVDVGMGGGSKASRNASLMPMTPPCWATVAAFQPVRAIDDYELRQARMATP
jgi:hypothetical protein